MRWRSRDRVLLLAIPIKLMLSPVPVPTRLEGLDVCGGHSGKTSQRQERGTDRHPGRRGTMMGLAMRTPHHRRQDLPRAAYARSCTRTMRINIAGASIDYYRTKKVSTKEL